MSAGIQLVPWLLNFLFDAHPTITPKALDLALKALEDEGYADKSYRVLNIGAPNYLPAYSSEIGIPVGGDLRHIKAVEVIMAIAERHRSMGLVFHTAPVALRFVKASEAQLSMMYGQTTMMIELIQMTDTEGGSSCWRHTKRPSTRWGGGRTGDKSTILPVAATFWAPCIRRFTAG